MSLDRQDLVALAIVFTAAGYLIRLALGAVIGKSGVRSCTACDGCASAGGKVQAPQGPLVSIGPVPPRT